MKNAVIYARYSSASQREASIEDQIADCRSYAKRLGYNIIKIYADHALSGTSDHRPEFQQMIEDAGSGDFQYVICYKTDRFARSRRDASKYKQLLKNDGVRVVYSQMAIPDGPEGIILEGVMESLDEYYSANLSQNIRRGQTSNAKKAMANGVMIFGYDIDKDGHYIINEHDAEAVRTVFRMSLDGLNDAEIIEWLNDNGYRNSRCHKFTKSAVARILKNRKYLGEYKYSEIFIKDGLPAIVDKDIFEKANEYRKGRKGHHGHMNATEYLLSGLLFCGKCGASLSGMYGTSKSGKKHYYYTCSNAKKKKCDFKNIRRDDLDQAVLNTLNTYIYNDDVLNDIADAVIKYHDTHDTHNKLDMLTNERAEKQKALDNITKAIEMGAFNKDMIKRMNELSAEVQELDANIAKENLVNKKIDKDFVIFILKEMRESLNKDDITKKKLVNIFIDRIYVFDDHIVMTFNYMKNGHFATLEDTISIEKQNVRLSSIGGAKKYIFEHLNAYIDDNNLYYFINIKAAYH